MGSFSNYAELKILELIVGKTGFTTPTCYLALSTADPTEDGSGLAEPSGNNYSRKQTAGTDWATAANGQIQNSGALAFAQASGSWGTVTHFALYDNSTGGNMLAYGTLTESKVVGNGDTVSFAANAITITLD